VLFEDFLISAPGLTKFRSVPIFSEILQLNLSKIPRAFQPPSG